MAGDRHTLCEEDQFILGGCTNPMPISLAQNLVTTDCRINTEYRDIEEKRKEGHPVNEKAP
jgi:hypothetical protein